MEFNFSLFSWTEGIESLFSCSSGSLAHLCSFAHAPEVHVYLLQDGGMKKEVNLIVKITKGRRCFSPTLCEVVFEYINKQKVNKAKEISKMLIN